LFFVYLLTFSFSLLQIEFGVIPSSKVDRCLTEWINLLFLFENIFSILFYIIFANFKVLDTILESFFHILIVKGRFRKGSLYLILFLFSFLFRG
jgi:hypothetical protein